MEDNWVSQLPPAMC